MCLHCLHPLIQFFDSLNNPKFVASVDVYAPMFFCDLITFLIVVFGYDKFGPSVSFPVFISILYLTLYFYHFISFVFFHLLALIRGQLLKTE